MGHSQAEKAATRERILRAASRRIRTDGVDRPGVAELMQEAGLTHGGFYKHFNSRDDLITQAAAFALSEGTAKMERSARKNPEDARAGLIDAYLAKQHRDGPATGCALVTLGAAAGRGDQQIQQAYENQVRTYLDLIAGLDEDADTPAPRRCSRSAHWSAPCSSPEPWPIRTSPTSCWRPSPSN